jgi:NADPH:quinone reductase-like Zn-dependent oxidoreductase
MRPDVTIVITSDEDKPLVMPMGDLIMKRIRIVGSRQNTREDLYEPLRMAAKSMGMTRQITLKQEHSSMAKETMKAWQVSHYAADSLHMADHPLPEPGANQILLKVGAVSLHHRDKMAIEGEFGTDHPLPFVPASDAAGIVAAVGSNAHRFKVGDRITAHAIPRWLRGKVLSPEESLSLGLPLPAVLAEYVLLDEDGAVPTPAYLSDQEASALPIAAVTACRALFDTCQLQPGDTVLVQGTGGVSLFALQLARAAGARVLLTSSSDEKLKRARELGADVGINYARDPAWNVAVKALTNGMGVDHVLDLAGGESVARSLDAVTRGATS